jgi:hypothetical protein
MKRTIQWRHANNDHEYTNKLRGVASHDYFCFFVSPRGMRSPARWNMEMHLWKNMDPFRVLDARPVRVWKRQTRDMDNVWSL